LYAAPLIISNTVQVRARAFLPNTNYFPGPPNTASYIALSNTVVNFSSDLPIVVLHTVGTANIPTGFPSPDESVIFAVFDADSGPSSLTNAPQLIKRAGLNVRGSSTQDYPKQAFALELWDEFNQDDKVGVLGMPAES